MKELASHPSAILKIIRGSDAVGEQLALKQRQKWASQSIKLKKTKYFDIVLNPKDTTGPSSSIGPDGVYEPAETSLFLKLLYPEMTFVDVGANIGWYTLLAASKVKSKGQVIAFEPEPSNYALLSQSVALNKFYNVVLMRKCAFNKKGTSYLWIASKNLGAHSLIEKNNQDEQIEVETVRLDDALAEIGHQKIDILKIDVEGAEPEVLEGVEQTINLGVEHVIFEWQARVWKTKTDIFNRLFANYKMFRITNSPFLIKEITQADLQATAFCNLYLRKSRSN